MEPALEIPYPSGFYAATTTENAKHCFMYNPNHEQEMNFNDFVYFISEDGTLTDKVVEYDVIRKIVSNPKGEQHRNDKMMMVNEDGVIFPAHLPHIADVVGKPDVQATIRELEKEDYVEYEGTTKIIPKLLVDKMDPKPKIPTAGPIYSLGVAGFTTEFGSYTDDVVFFKVRAPFTRINYSVFRDQFIEDDLTSRYQAVSLQPKLEANKEKLKIGSAVVLWNGRRITRPSFVEHFKQIAATHNPIMMIVTEVGASSTNCERILAKLGTNLSYRFDAGGGMLGGTVIFWNP
ncbi:uncharacterized protein LOC110718735 [Chenopodium quinoa]|uniref:uncharacterized protein LOC110718735 n=1 Tax=Chenopodium quinoa TaxID=63459 RepID=UPI000B772D59|nr:uncharacterized protein LOC110718735 [Chenopodium quinoa]